MRLCKPGFESGLEELEIDKVGASFMKLKSRGQNPRPINLPVLDF
jgi:hypothetical protein